MKITRNRNQLVVIAIVFITLQSFRWILFRFLWCIWTKEVRRENMLLVYPGR